MAVYCSCFPWTGRTLICCIHWNFTDQTTMAWRGDNVNHAMSMFKHSASTSHTANARVCLQQNLSHWLLSGKWIWPCCLQAKACRFCEKNSRADSIRSAFNPLKIISLQVQLRHTDVLPIFRMWGRNIFDLDNEMKRGMKTKNEHVKRFLTFLFSC